MSPVRERQHLWQQLVERVHAEYLQLEPAERRWITETCDRISQLQEQLDALFRDADGLEECRDCRGDCCALGHNHLTLANLLLLFERQVELPWLDFSATCPLLGPTGCLLPASFRPYNCISFLCDRIEGRQNPLEVKRFYALEGELRALYQAFAVRYRGGSLSGLLLAARRLGDNPFLQRIAQS